MESKKIISLILNVVGAGAPSSGAFNPTTGGDITNGQAGASAILGMVIIPDEISLVKHVGDGGSFET